MPRNAGAVSINPTSGHLLGNKQKANFANSSTTGVSAQLMQSSQGPGSLAKQSTLSATTKMEMSSDTYSN